MMTIIAVNEETISAQAQEDENMMNVYFINIHKEKINTKNENYKHCVGVTQCCIIMEYSTWQFLIS